MVDPTSNLSNPLARLVDERYRLYQANRVTAEEKWARNYDVIHGVFKAAWKEDEGQNWRSKFTYRFANQKATALFSLICDTVLTGGEIPFAAKVAKAFGADAGAYDVTLRAQEELIKSQIQSTGGEREFMRLVKGLCYYGHAWYKMSYDRVQEEQFTEAVAEGVDTTGMPMPMRRWLETGATELSPSFHFVPNSSVYWDMEARTRQDWTGVIHEDFCTAGRLREMAQGAGYLPDQVELAITDTDRESTYGSDASVEPRLREMARRSRPIRLREAYLLLPRRRLDEFEATLQPGMQLAYTAPDPQSDNAGDDAWALVLLAGNRVIRFLRITFDDVPLYPVICEEDIDSAVGVGVADHAEDVQTAINGAIRLFLDNKNLSANGVLAVKEEFLESTPTRFYPGLKLRVSQDCPDARMAVSSVVFADVGSSLVEALNLLFGLGEDETSVPKVTQGLSDISGASPTAFEIGKRVEMAQKYVGTVIRNIDEMFIQPAISWYLRQNRSNPEYAQFAGPFRIEALGFTSFLNRQIKVQRLMQRLQLAAQSPQIEALTKMRNILEEIDKMLDFAPDQFTPSAEELQQQQQLAAQVAQDEAAAAAGLPPGPLPAGLDPAAQPPAMTEPPIPPAEVGLASQPPA